MAPELLENIGTADVVDAGAALDQFLKPSSALPSAPPGTRYILLPEANGSITVLLEDGEVQLALSAVRADLAQLLSDENLNLLRDLAWFSTVHGVRTFIEWGGPEAVMSVHGRHEGFIRRSPVEEHAHTNRTERTDFDFPEPEGADPVARDVAVFAQVLRACVSVSGTRLPRPKNPFEELSRERLCMLRALVFRPHTRPV